MKKVKVWVCGRIVADFGGTVEVDLDDVKAKGYETVEDYVRYELPESEFEKISDMTDYEFYDIEVDAD